MLTHLKIMQNSRHQNRIEKMILFHEKRQSFTNQYLSLYGLSSSHKLCSGCLWNAVELVFLDRINRIIWIYFLRHFPDESDETESRLMGGKNSNLPRIMWIIAIITYKYHCSFYAFAEGDWVFGFHPRPPRLSPPGIAWGAADGGRGGSRWRAGGKPKRIS